MDLFDSTYYIINKTLNRCIGCWPHQKNWEKIITRLFMFFLNISALGPELLHMALCRKNFHLFIDALPIFFTHMAHITKYLTYLIKSDEISAILNAMEQNWNSRKTKEEYTIMQTYASYGRIISVSMLSVYYSFTTLYMLMPLVPRILDRFHPLNESRQFIYIFDGEYLIDQQKCYLPICIHHCILAMAMMCSIIATDATYGVFIFHACGLFDIVRNELINMKILNNLANDNDAFEKAENKRKIIDCIKKHKNAMNFCEMIEDVHTTAMFILLLMNVISLTMSGVQTMTHLQHPPQAIRFAVCCITHGMHMFYYCWTSQKISNHSSEIYNAAYNSKWYISLDESSHLLKFVMLRSSKAYTQTAGGMFPMTLMNFTVVVKTSISYFTVIMNFQ